MLGHFEYGRDTLAQEYWRDFHAGLPIQLPVNYFPDDNPEKQPIFTWRAHANLLYRNWLNYLYQTSSYKREDIPEIIAELRDNAGSLLNEDGAPSKF